MRLASQAPSEVVLRIRRLPDSWPHMNAFAHGGHVSAPAPSAPAPSAPAPLAAVPGDPPPRRWMPSSSMFGRGKGAKQAAGALTLSSIPDGELERAPVAVEEPPRMVVELASEDGASTTSAATVNTLGIMIHSMAGGTTARAADSTAPLHVQVDLMKRGHVANARADFKQAHALFRQAYEASGRIEARISAASMFFGHNSNRCCRPSSIQSR
eukprot:1127343-Prymnesium_polylepis.1